MPVILLLEKADGLLGSTNRSSLSWRWGFPGGPVVKNPPASAGDARDAGSIPGSGKSPGIENGNPLWYLAWRIPWTKEPGKLQSIGLQSQT